MRRSISLKELEGLAAPEAIRAFLGMLYESAGVQAVLVPKRVEGSGMVSQVLVADPARLEGVDPLSPVQMINAAHAVRELAKEPLATADGKIAVVLRPCELRAVVELAKLKQLLPESLYLIGYDCPGVYDLKEYRSRLESQADADRLRTEVLDPFMGEGAGEAERKLRGACQVCTRFTAEGADLSLSWIGAGGHALVVEVLSEKGEELLQGFGAEAEEIAELPARKKRIEALRARRAEAEEREPLGLLEELQVCIRCYNCREVCPICYCKECLLVPAKMGYSSERYLNRARKKGQIKMPVDTVLYHLTKMNHMACSCVACGLCEQACPMDIPLGRIYSRVGRNVQELFDYVPGRSLEEELPVSTFKEEELPGVEDVKR